MLNNFYKLRSINFYLGETRCSVIFQTLIHLKFFKGVEHMPTWLRKQFKKAYFEKNYNEIKLLNQCWFYYLRKKQLVDVKKT